MKGPQMRHTPPSLPWEYVENLLGTYTIKPNGNFENIGEIDKKELAAFVVQAVNSHKELVVALKKSYEILKDLYDRYQEVDDATMDDIHTALLKATEGEKE